jgi:hypothetical protein
MLTIKVITNDRKEQIKEVENVVMDWDYHPPSLFFWNVVDKYPESANGCLVYVMNEAGKTIAVYDMVCRPTEG